MTDKHNKSFFGNTVGMILDSPSKTEQSIFLTFLRKKPDGGWEKPSGNEGKRINLNLEEIVMLLEVLQKRQQEWSTIHKFKDSSTTISLSWVKDQKEVEKFCIQVNGYKKYLNFAECVLLRKLLDHLLDEKIEFATIPYQRAKENGTDSEEGMPAVLEVVEEIESAAPSPILPPKRKGDAPPDTSLVKGVVRGETEKAVLVLFESGKEVWVPKSTIRSSFNASSESLQQFTIDTWILEKNKLLS